MKKTALSLVAVCALFGGLLVATLPSNAADHLEAPAVQMDGRTDINDLYAFQSPTNAANSVLIMTVNPLAGIVSGGTFDPAATYTFQIDNDGDAVQDLSISATFGAVVGSVQTVSITGDAGNGSGDTGTDFALSSGGTATAGFYEDPFFFDLAGFNDGLNFTGDDTLAGANVSGLVIEVPSAMLNGASSNIGVWAETSVGGAVVDRMGRPAIATVLINSSSKDAFNGTAPVDHFANFGAMVNANIAALSNQTNADNLTPVLLPDILTFDTSSNAGFLNGRQLADDVIDAALNLLTDGALTTGDGVPANDVAFPGVFPYLAAPNLMMCQNLVVTVDLALGHTPTEGDDVISGTSAADTIDALGGDDVVCALDGDDTVNGGDGDDRLYGMGGDDMMSGDDGRDYLRGDTGDDTLMGGLGRDTLVGQGGNDALWGEGGSDRLYGVAGENMMDGGSGADRMWGGDGVDTMRGMGGQDQMWGMGGDDIMQGNWQSDVMNGGDGNDFMAAAGGIDTLNGDAGNDTMYGGNNSDTLNGGDGDDFVNGVRGNDTCDGGAGTNAIFNC